MNSGNVNPFEYVSILISLILGLGITQILSSFTDLMYHYKKVKFYWPHSIWVIFILFLHIQDWYITFQLQHKKLWYLTDLLFILLYPIALFAVAKMLLPTNQSEENFNMRAYYKSQFPIIFFIFSLAIVISIIFNIVLLKNTVFEQIPFILFLITMLYFSISRNENDWLHKLLAIIISIITIVSIFVGQDTWAIK